MLLLATYFPGLKVVHSGTKTPVVTRGRSLRAAETCRKPKVVFLPSRDYARFLFCWCGFTVLITREEKETSKEARS